MERGWVEEGEEGWVMGGKGKEAWVMGGKVRVEEGDLVVAGGVMEEEKG